MEGKISFQSEVAPGHFLLSVDVAGEIDPPLPGQFAMLRPFPTLDPLLARPLSIYGYRRSEGAVRLEFLYRVVGKGTRLLSALIPGDKVGVMGPLGKGFRVPEKVERIVIIAGGMGVAPLTYLAEYCRTRDERIPLMVYLGARTSGLIVGEDRLRNLVGYCRIMTEDGSCGDGGLVTDGVKCDLSVIDGPDTYYFACGPAPMLKELSVLLGAVGSRCQVSLEERMACGVGACLGCAVLIRRYGKECYTSVCKEGPVFALREVVWEAK